METFTDFLNTLGNPQQEARFLELFAWVEQTFPQLLRRIAWNQPMYTDHGTFIIGFSASKKHLAAAPEVAGIERFSKEIKTAGFSHTAMLIRFPWNKVIDYALLEKIIRFNIEDKKDCPTFWRKTSRD